MKYLNNFIFIIFASVIFSSCHKSTEPLNKEKIYTVNITYIKDDGIMSFEPMDFFDIFNKNLSRLTYKTLGYKIEYNLKYGMSDNEFYNANRRTIVKNAALFKRDYIDIKKIDHKSLENDILLSLSNETSFNIKKLFGYEYGTPLNTIAENIAPSYVQNIHNVWSSPAKTRKELLLGSRFMIYTALYWRIAAKEFEDSSIIIVNMPLTSNYRYMSAKSIADGGFVDRIVIENNNIRYSKSLSVISTYHFLSNIQNKDQLKSIFSYYIVQTIGMMFAKYDIHPEEKHSIMAEVNNFDYISWCSNIVNFPLKTPYKTITEYKDSIK